MNARLRRLSRRGSIHRWLLLAAGLWMGLPPLAAAKIGVLLKGQSAFWSAVEAGCREAAAEHGIDVLVRAPVSESDIAVQVQLLEELAREELAALVIAPTSSTALSAPVAAVAARGVKVVVIDSPLDADMSVYIATNHTNAGTAAGELLASLVGSSDEVSFLKHSKTGGATMLREVSAYSALRKSHPGIVVHRDIFSGTVSGEELGQAHRLLREHPGTTAVLASGTPGTLAMLQALEESGRAGAVKFVGFGFNLNATVAAALERGAMHGWIAQLPAEIGGRGVRAAAALLAREPVAEVIYCNFLVITRDNLQDPRVQALLPR